ncbi:MAG: haloacid dehalogenase-like hydrolase [Pirellulales bacterium]
MHVCLFDIDGTIMASGGAGKAALEEAFLAEFAVPAIVADVPMSGRTDRAIARDFFLLHAIPETPENWDRFRTSYLRRLPASLTARRGRVLPGVTALLDRLGETNDVLLGLLTGNLQAGARIKLAHHGLAERFSFGAFGDVHLDRDSVAREAWEAIRSRLAHRALCDRVWVIGDTPLDVACARAIGARAIAVATGTHTWDELSAASPDMLFADLSDASELLGRLVP